MKKCTGFECLFKPGAFSIDIQLILQLVFLSTRITDSTTAARMMATMARRTPRIRNKPGASWKKQIVHGEPPVSCAPFSILPGKAKKKTRHDTGFLLRFGNYSSSSASSSRLVRSNSSFSPQLGQMTSPSSRMDSSKKISSSQVGQVVA